MSSSVIEVRTKQLSADEQEEFEEGRGNIHSKSTSHRDPYQQSEIYIKSTSFAGC